MYDPGMDTQSAIAQLLPVLRDFLVTILVPYALYAIQKRIKNREASDALQELVSTTALCVADAEQRVVRDAKDPTRPGTWSAALGAEVKAKVLEDVKQIAAVAIQTLVTTGKIDASKIDMVLERMIEQHKLSLSQSAATASASIPPPAAAPVPAPAPAPADAKAAA